MSNSLVGDEVLLRQISTQLGLESGEAKEVLMYLDTFTDRVELAAHLREMLGDGEATVDRALSTKFPHQPSANLTPESSLEHADPISDGGSCRLEPKVGLGYDLPNLQDQPKVTKPTALKPAVDQFYRKGEVGVLEEYRVSRKAKAPPVTVNQSGSNLTEASFQKKAEEAAVVEPTKSVKVRENRKECACYGLKHEVFLNCLKCGRIMCKVEGPGPCFFCKCPVLSVTQQRQACPKFCDESAEVEAQAHLERLLEFDRTSAARTQVIDQASDYSIPELLEPADQWLSPAERARALEAKKDKLEALEKQRRGPRVLSLDLKSRKVTVAPLAFTPKPSKAEGGTVLPQGSDAEGPEARGSITYCRSELPRAKYIPQDEAKVGEVQSKAKAAEEMSAVELKRFVSTLPFTEFGLGLS
ncbi:hypothetical protein L0F63_001120 [Massospora cicadina]|nr:hypothetical protein L0F63_001120 [Massospora cicadina]